MTTDEDFDRKLEEILEREKWGSKKILSIPGIYEILAEHFNNDVLRELEEENDHE